MPIDPKEIDQLFAIAIAKPVGMNKFLFFHLVFPVYLMCSLETKSTGPPKPVIVNILDMRKGNNIGTITHFYLQVHFLKYWIAAIGLSQIKGVSAAVIAEVILNGRDGVLTTEHLEMLAKYIPTTEEVSALISTCLTCLLTMI